MAMGTNLIDELRGYNFGLNSDQVNSLDDEELSELDDLIDQWFIQLGALRKEINGEMDLRGIE